MNDDVKIEESVEKDLEENNSIRASAVKLPEDTIKDIAEVKHDDDSIFKELYDQLLQCIKDANNSSMKAIEIAQQVFSIQGDQSKQEIGDYFSEVSTPLIRAVESFGLSVTSLQYIGKTFYGIIDNSELEYIQVKKEVPTKLEDDENINDVDEANESFELPDDCKEFNKDKVQKEKKRHLKKYKCNECKYSSYYTFVMKAHLIKKHHLDKVAFLCEHEHPEIKHFLCELCRYSSTKESTLKAHVQKKHRKEVKELKEEDTNGNGIEDDSLLENDDETSYPLSDNNEDTETIIGGAEYKCTRCEYTAKKKVYLDDHLNGGLQFVKCPWCDAHFKHSAKGKLGRHLIAVHSLIKADNKWTCGNCDSEFERTRDLIHHTAKAHNVGTMYHCDKCNYSSIDRRNLTVHSEFHGVASFPCMQCDYAAKSKDRLRKHVYNTHKEAECTICNRKFSKKQSLFQHNKIHHGSGVRPVCDICGKSFQNATVLATHMKGVHGDKNIQCDQCDYTTNSHQNFYYHMRTKHQEIKYLCEECDYSSISKATLTAHIKSKHQKIRYSCDVCDMKFTADCSMRRHKQQKHSDKSLKLRCPEQGCEYATKDVYLLKVHSQKVHEGIRYPCDLCEYVGGYKGDLSRHKKIVHDGFIFDCSLCEYKSPKKYHMKEHLLREHGVDQI